MYMDEGMDTGDMILKQEVQIGEDETTGELWNRLAIIGGNLLVETLNQVAKGIAPRIKQEGEGSIAPMLDKEIAKIDWNNKTALEIKNLVRGLNPIMGAYSNLNGKKIKFWKVQNISVEDFIKEHNEFQEYEYRFKDIDPGTIIYVDKKVGIYVKTKDSIILILEIQGENAKKMTTPEFLRGNKIEVIDKFE